MTHGDDGELLLYQAEDGRARIQVRLAGNSLWLTQQQLAELYQSTPQNITQHIRAIYADGELLESATCKPYLQVRAEGSRTVRRELKHYNLDVVLAVGYRVRSHRGVQFRQWASDTLKTYLVKGFALDDERFKRGADADYFDELLARIRDIRSSEKMFWRKVLDIYATSIDYDPSAEASQRFFATVQNKMHWAAHGHTAAELVALRADAGQPHMGLTSWAAASQGGAPRKSDAVVAKNYLTQDELEVLNRVVNAYLEFAELQALNRHAVTMAQWIAKLDDFLRLSGREVLTNAGHISAEAAQAKAHGEFERYQSQQKALPSKAEQDFEAALLQPVKALERVAKAKQAVGSTSKKKGSS
ncbi:MAG: virulence RhuM family protein [Inhella sp.]|uniref:virulence RhuM family protein n=1 Tax=Inhella sp. TaxID=1921806 RepID=UPI0022BFB091|nr:virulence RhuM family protein [Inhella sp.]MCZ8234802.1 virulence RhuM family protein [Inhella sp.]